MDNPFTHASRTPKKLKVLLYGVSGIGKTRFSLTFPRPVVIDMERGTDWYGDEFSFDVLHTKSVAAVRTALNYLVEHRDAYDTLVIDPVTVLYEQLQSVQQEVAERRAARKRQDVDEAGLTYRDWGRIKAQWNDIFAAAVNAGYHVIGVARQRDKYSAEHGELTVIGVKPGADKDSEYWFDTVIQLVYRKEQIYAIIDKDRTGLFQGARELPLGDLRDAALAAAHDAASHGCVVEETLEEILEQDVSEAERHSGPQLPLGTEAPATANGHEARVICPKCGQGEMVLRKSKSGAPFFGCSRWKPNGEGCNGTMNHADYRKAAGQEEPAKLHQGGPPSAREYSTVKCPKCAVGNLYKVSGVKVDGSTWEHWKCEKCEEKIWPRQHSELQRAQLAGAQAAATATVQGEDDPFRDQ